MILLEVGKQVNSVEFCYYRRGLSCSRSGHCDIFDRITGNVGICSLHPNPSGRFKRKEIF